MDEGWSASDDLQIHRVKSDLVGTTVVRYMNVARLADSQKAFKSLNPCISHVQSRMQIQNPFVCHVYRSMQSILLTYCCKLVLIEGHDRPHLAWH